MVVMMAALSAFAQAPQGLPQSACVGGPACERECERGVATACTRAGLATVESDPLRAVGLLQRACDGTDGAGCAALGELYERGKGIKADPARGFQMKALACDRRHGPSCVTIARAYEKGAFALKDNARIAGELSRAAQFFYKGCDAGAATACGDLAVLYVIGAGIQPDPVGGAVLAQRGCDKGDAWACRYLGWLYEEGIGVQKDAKRASDFYRKGKDAESRDEPLMLPPLPLPTASVVTVESDPPGALISVDTLRVGPAPVVVTLTAGEHRFVAVAKGKPELTQLLTTAAGRADKVALAWPATLVFETTPSGALLKLDGKDVGKSPFKGQVPAGAHTVTAELLGFTPGSKAVTTRAGEETQEKLTLASAPGSLSIETTPPGASVTIDGVVQGVTPWVGSTTPGKHALALELAGHLSVKKTIAVKAGALNSERATLEPEMVLVTVRSVPPKAEVKVDGVVKGNAPWSGKVQVGVHQLVVSLDGYEPDTSSLELVSKAKPLLKDVRLKEMPATLKLTSTPAGAHVFIDDVSVGVTPFVGPVQVGTHVVAVRLTGYKEASEGVKATMGVVIERSLTLQVLPVEVTVETVPPGASVAVDGVAAANPSPVKLSLLPGAHSVHAAKEGFEPREVPFELVAGLGTTWKVELREAQLAKAPDLPLPPPPPTGDAAGPPPPMPTLDPQADLRARAAMLADPSAPPQEKLKLLDQLATSNGDLTQFIAQVQPEGLRGELCMKWQNRVYPARLVVKAFDAYKDEVPAMIVLHGTDLAVAPFDGQVPSCVSTVSVRRVDTGEKLEHKLVMGHLDTHTTNRLEFDFGGRPPRMVIGLVGNYAPSAPVFTPGNPAPTQEPETAGGLLMDYWGRAFHFSMALKAMTQFKDVIPGAPAVPGVDLYFGLGSGFPNRTESPVRFHFAVDVGVFDLVCPSARLTLALNIKDRFFLMLIPGVALHPAEFLPAGNFNRIDPFPLDQVLFQTFSAALGFAF